MSEPEPSERALAMAKDVLRFQRSDGCLNERYMVEIALIIEKHMARLSAKTAVSEIHGITLRDLDFGPDEQLNEIIDIIRRIGRTVSDVK